MNGLGKCRQKRNALQAQPLACRPRREGARMVGSGHLAQRVSKPGRGSWMYSLLLENSIKELTAGDLECVGPDEFLEVPLPPTFPTPH